MKKSISVKILGIIFVGILILTVILMFVSIKNAKNQVDKDIQVQMTYLMENIKSKINIEFANHEKLAENISKIYSLNQDKMSKIDYKDLISEVLRLNKNTLGSGIWIEPYKYNRNEKFFGPYVYKDGSKLVYTIDYEKEEYNYPSQDWYIETKAIPENSSGSLGSNWTDPYYDDQTGITMITTTVPIFDKGKFIGVVSADYDLVSIQEMVSNIKIGKEGTVLLADSSGVIIAGPNKEDIMKKSLSSFDEYADLIASYKMEALNISEAEINKNEYKVFSVAIPDTSWKIVVNIPKDELYSDLNKTILQIVIVSLIAIVITLIITFILIKNMIIKPIDIIRVTMGKLSDYNLNLDDERAKVKRYMNAEDEIGEMIRSISAMINNLRNIIQNITEHASNTAATAQELTATAQTTNDMASEVDLAVRNISEGAVSQADDTTKTATTIEENGKFLNEMIEMLTELKNAMMDIDQKKDEGRNAIEDLTVLSDKTKKETDFVSQIIVETNESVESISKASEMIQSIADQTNLLALNAAIELAVGM